MKVRSRNKGYRGNRGRKYWNAKLSSCVISKARVEENAMENRLETSGNKANSRDQNHRSGEYMYATKS